jgi:hypothetical protein
MGQKMLSRYGARGKKIFRIIKNGQKRLRDFD